MRAKAKLTLLGYVGRNPSTPSSKNPDFVTFPLAVTETWKDDAGDKQSRTEWYEVVTSQKGKSELVRNYVKKGDPLYIEGTPRFSTYTSKDGEVKPKVNVNISEIVLLASKNDNKEERVEEEAKPKTKIPSNPTPVYEEINGKRYLRSEPAEAHADLDDDIPF